MSAYDAFRAAVESGDHAGMVAALAPDAVLRSPVSFKPFEGREAVAGLFAILLETFEDFRYTDEFEADGKAALVFRARVGDRDTGTPRSGFRAARLRRRGGAPRPATPRDRRRFPRGSR